MLEKAGIPILLLDRSFLPYPERSSHDLVSIDHRCAGYLVTEHFLKLGCRRIAFVAYRNAAQSTKSEAAWRHEGLTDGYACEEGTFESGRNEPCAQIPFLVEAWAKTCKPRAEADEDHVYPVEIIGFTINRSPAIVQSSPDRKGRSRNVWLTLGDSFSYLTVTQGALAPVEDGFVRISFHDKYGIAAESLSRPNNLNLLREIAKEVLGSEFDILVIDHYLDWSDLVGSSLGFTGWSNRRQRRR